MLTLDLEAIKGYITEENYKVLEEIVGDAAKKDAFLKTIGTAQHMTESNFLMIRSSAYVYSKWYSDAKSAGTLPSKLDDLNTTDIESIYNNYYLTAPYQLVLLTETAENIENGAVTFDISEILSVIGVENIESLNTNNMLVYMFGQNAYDNYSPTTSEELKGLSECFNAGLDMHKINTYIQATYPDYNNAETPIRWLTEIEPQFTNEKTCDKINKWAAKNMEVYVSNYNVTTFMPLTFDNISSDDALVSSTFYGQYMGRLTANEVELLKTNNVVHPLTTDGTPVTFFQFTNSMIKILLATEVIK